MNFNENTPIQELFDPVCEDSGVRLLVKREDLNHPFISGNKWWKLKYNLEAARTAGKKNLLTFGGAYSNHIYATAAAAKEYGFDSIGIIRGEEERPLNDTLQFARACGMHLHFVSREEYRLKSEPGFMDSLKNKFNDFYLIPEGGTNDLAIRGCEEFARKILTETDFDVLCLPVGTGGTMAGMISGFEGKKEVLGFSALKGGDFLEEEVRNLLGHYSGKETRNSRIETNYHFGGYGKTPSELGKFIEYQRKQHNLPLDKVYTGKMMYGVYDLINKSRFKRGTTILVLHTGGLQGG